MKRDTLAGLAIAIVIHAVLLFFLCSRPVTDPAVLAFEIAPINVNLLTMGGVPSPVAPAPPPLTPPAPPAQPEPAATPPAISESASEPSDDLPVPEPVRQLASIIDSPELEHPSESIPSHGRTRRPAHAQREKSTTRIAASGGGAVSNAPGAGAPAPGSSARYRVNPQPEYPSVARRSGQQGVVTLDVTVDANGRVSNIAIVRSSGFPALDHAALEAVREWLFDPARTGGVAVESHVRIPVRFSLTG